jgi:hypothetical protein
MQSQYTPLQNAIANTSVKATAIGYGLLPVVAGLSYKIACSSGCESLNAVLHGKDPGLAVMLPLLLIISILWILISEPLRVIANAWLLYFDIVRSFKKKHSYDEFISAYDSLYERANKRLEGDATLKNLSSKIENIPMLGRTIKTLSTWEDRYIKSFIAKAYGLPS